MASPVVPEPLVTLSPGVAIRRVGQDRFQIGDGAARQLTLTGADRALLQCVTSCPDAEAALKAFPARLGDLSRADVIEFVEQLHKHGLTKSGSPRRWSVGQTSAKAAEGTGTTDGVNFAFDLLALAFGWALSPWMAPLLGLLALAAVNVAVREWGAIIADSVALIGGLHWTSLVALVYVRILLLISLPTALLVGIACRLGGGRVRSFGFSLWEDVVPLFDTDTGESLVWMPPRDRRRLISACVALPLALASISLIGWSMSDGPHGSREFWLLMIAPAVFALLARCNPFARGPAYWWLCDYWDDWRLREGADEELRLGRLADSLTRPISKVRRRRRTYGAFFSAYRFVRDSALLIGGSWLAIDLLGGTGALLMIVATAWWNRRRVRRWLSPWLLAPA